MIEKLHYHFLKIQAIQKFPNQVQRENLVSVRTCNLQVLTLPIPILVFEVE